MFWIKNSTAFTLYSICTFKTKVVQHINVMHWRMSMLPFITVYIPSVNVHSHQEETANLKKTPKKKEILLLIT